MSNVNNHPITNTQHQHYFDNNDNVVGVAAAENVTVATILNALILNYSSTTAAAASSLSSLSSTITITTESVQNDHQNDLPQIPAYIRTTSMVFCITIMLLGVIGNIMVRN